MAMISERATLTLGIMGGLLAGAGLIVYAVAPQQTMAIAVAEGLAMTCLAVFLVTHFEMFRDFSLQLHQEPAVLDDGAGRTLVHGADGGHAHGSTSLRRFYVTDGASRIFPLRERFSQRCEKAIERVWPSYNRQQGDEPPAEGD